MSVFSDNIGFLRGQKKISQNKLAEDLILTRSRYVSYEYGVAEPPIEVLIRMSKYYNISIDLLVTIDIRKYPLEDIVKLPDNRIVLPIKVDETGDNKIEIIPHKAQMGYIGGYSDVGYIDSLQHMSLPFLRNGKYRAFPVEGESMPPYNDGSFMLGKYVESKEHLKHGKTYIFITKEGIVYKRFEKQNKKGTSLISDNVFYKPYEIEWQDVLEIWEFAGSVNTKELDVLDTSSIKIMINDISKILKI